MIGSRNETPCLAAIRPRSNWATRWLESTPISDVFARLEARHGAAKGDDAWIRPRGHGKELARDADDTWQLPTVATLHGYRLTAFGQILADLRRARR